MRPSIAFNMHRQAVRDLAEQFRLKNPRVFGSVLHGTDKDGGDLDILVDAPPGTTLFDLGGLQDALEQLLKVPIDLVTPGGLPKDVRDAIVAEAQPI